MGTAARPSREVIEAMEELGVLDWLPNRRIAVRANRRDDIARLERAIARERAPSPEWVGLAGGLALVAGAISAALTPGSPAPRSAVNSSAARARVIGTALACGAGMLGAWALITIGRSARR